METLGERHLRSSRVADLGRRRGLLLRRGYGSMSRLLLSFTIFTRYTFAKCKNVNTCPECRATSPGFRVIPYAHSGTLGIYARDANFLDRRPRSGESLVHGMTELFRIRVILFALC